MGHPHARPHVANRFLLRLDIVEFFPSIVSKDIRAYLQRKPEGAVCWKGADHGHFISLVCRDGRLTIGAPTSPAIANAICRDLDEEMGRIAAARRLTYTRYADDLFFSTNEADVLRHVPAEVEGVLSRLDFPANLRLNKKKVHHSSKRGRRVVTGLVLTPDGCVCLGRGRKRMVRALIHQLKRECLPVCDHRRLSGLLAFAKDVEPDTINSLTLKYGPSLIERAMMIPK